VLAGASAETRPAFENSDKRQSLRWSARAGPSATIQLMGNVEEASMAGVKQDLHHKLQDARAALLSKLEGLREYDMRRPMTPTGTNLLGLVKHLAGVEYGYLGTAFNRPPPDTMSWIDDGSIWEGADMWATPDESSEFIIGLYERACAHGDQTIADLDLKAEGSVAHWPPGRRMTTLGVLLIRVVAETAQHAGHADILRELIDGRAGPDHELISETEWRTYVAKVQGAADSFKADRA
jgi:hypothetical protein